jgi:hypothetical protein
VHANVLFGGLALGLAALLLGAAEVGFWVGRRAAPHSHPKAFDTAMAWQGAVLGLAALLIGFTFAMAANRFDSVNQHPDRFLFGTDLVGPENAAAYYSVYDLYAPLWDLLTEEAGEKVRRGNYRRLFDQARRRVRAWEAAHK